MYSSHTLHRLYSVSGYAAHLMRAVRLCEDMGVKNISVPETFFESAHNATAAQRKLRRAHFVGQLLTLLPFVRAAAVCNSLGLSMVHDASDIDLFIVAAAGRAWTARFFITAVLKIFRLRPGEARRDPVCASFFIDESIQDFSQFKISNDIYFHFWERSVLRLFGTHTTLERGGILPPPFAVRVGNVSRALQRVGEFFVSMIPEEKLQRAQIALFPGEVHAAAARNDTGVMWSAAFIKLHISDRRATLRDQIFS